MEKDIRKSGDQGAGCPPEADKSGIRISGETRDERTLLR
jgi:hypothetical protein